MGLLDHPEIKVVYKAKLTFLDLHAVYVLTDSYIWAAQAFQQRLARKAYGQHFPKILVSNYDFMSDTVQLV